ncbi:hypothetical protein [Paenibacillus apis]|uniref:hypothetical protein n=1 Tax=Paenibacillus apis TaxID=1792174 RepID=UPI00265B67D4|nr:hypothetical protein [Paenibacillus apis]
MNYFKIDIQRLFTNKMVLTLIVVLLCISIIDPITVFRHFSKFPESANTIGQNPFQFWMLMNSVSWGNSLYNNMFWIITVILTGLIYYEDKSTSMYMYQIIRKGKTQYLVSKFLSTGLFSFFIVFLILEINIFMTYTIFSDTNNITDYYGRLTPHEGSFVYKAFTENPINAVHIYTILNAFVISLFAIFSLCISMLLNFSNRYVTLLLPVILLYGIHFIFDSYPVLFDYNIRMILQPRAVSALTNIISWNDVFISLGGWLLVNLLLMCTIFYKLRDSYE